MKLRGWRRYALIGMGVFALLLVVAGARLDTALRKLDRGGVWLRDAEAQANLHRFDDARASLRHADGLFDAAHNAARSFGANVLGAIPLLGSPWAAVGDAAAAAREAAAAGVTLAERAAAIDGSAVARGGSHDLSSMHRPLVDVSAGLATATQRLRRAEELLDGPANAFLSPISQRSRRVRNTVVDLRQRVTRTRDGARLIAELTAPTTTARFLIVAQDTFELRPTGGFIGSYGVLRVDGGRVRLEHYSDATNLSPPNPPRDAPPDLQVALDRPWDLSNANWWPDFSYSAAVAADMHSRHGGGGVDGVIGLNEATLARLIRVLGPVELPGYAPVEADGLGARIVQEVELKRPADVPRKKFLTMLAQQVLNETFDVAGAQAPAMLTTLGEAATAGEIQVWFTNPERQRLLGDTPWAGKLPVTDGDFLMLVDSNMTAGKANAQLQRRVRYRIDPAADGLIATLDIRYSNFGKFVTVLNDYYNGLLRIYVPKGSQLLDPDDARDLGVAEDAPYQVFQVRPYVEAGGTDRITFSYRLPATVAPDGYQLTWWRQAGTRLDTLTAMIDHRLYTVPVNSRRLHIAPEG